VHLTETCDDDKPHLIVHAETTAATTPDWGMVEPIHHALAQQDCLPSTHVVDGGYTDADAIVTSQTKHEVDVLGPVVLENRGPRESRRCLRSLALPHRLAEPQGHVSHWTT
jgi:transposase